MQTLNKIVLT